MVRVAALQMNSGTAPGPNLEALERLAREAIRAIPDGLYEAEDFVDDNGFTTEPLRVKVAVEVDGDRLRVDFTGSARETKGMVNSPVCSTNTAGSRVRRLSSPAASSPPRAASISRGWCG